MPGHGYALRTTGEVKPASDYDLRVKIRVTGNRLASGLGLETGLS